MIGFGDCMTIFHTFLNLCFSNWVQFFHYIDMNNILLGILVIAGIMIAATYAATSIGDVSHASTQSNQIDIEKKSESMNILFDGEKIDITNTAKYDSDIAMFRFYNESGTEVHRTIIPDTEGRVFGEGVPLVKDTALTSDDAYLQSHVLESYTLADIGIDSLDYLTGEIVTKRGRTFPIVFENQGQNNNSTTNSDLNSPESIALSMIDGMGLQSRIIQNENDGRITHGNGMIGQDDSIKPYLPVAANTDFAATVLEGDNKETHYIPAFWKSYQYTGSSLTDNTPSIPNILGYSTSKSMSDSNTISLTNDGITVSGTGIRIIKLNEITENIILRGTLDNADVKIVTSPLDLTTLSMSGNNYELYKSTYPSKSGSTISSNPNILVASESNISASYDYSVNCESYGKRGSSVSSCHTINNAVSHSGCYYSNCNVYHSHSASGSLATTITSSTDPTGTYVTKLSSTTSGSSLHYEYPLKILTPPASTPFAITGSVTQSLYSSSPWNEQLYFTDNFEQSVTLPTNSYLVITLSGGSALIKAESGNSNQGFINIDGLNTNIPYQITKDSIAIATGMTSVK